MTATTRRLAAENAAQSGVNEGRAFAERFAEIRDRLDALWSELPLHFPTTEGWVRVTRDIDEATKDLRAVSSDWAAYLRGVA